MNRIKYLDAMKAIGIFCVYCIHRGEVGGPIYHFSFYAVAMFFFVSGCSERISEFNSFVLYLQKRFKQIIIPYFIFAFTSLVIQIIDFNHYEVAFKWFAQILLGCIRNQFFAGSLWFLTTLFVMSILFQVIKKIRYPMLMVLICLILYIIAEVALPYSPLSKPSWVWNIDSVLEYVVYYSIGYAVQPYMHRVLESTNRKVIQLKNIIFLIAIIYSILLFLGHNALNRLIDSQGLVVVFQPLFENIIVVIGFVCVGKVLSRYAGLVLCGQNSLILCGCEFIVEVTILRFLDIFGIDIRFNTPFEVVLYVLFVIYITNRCVVPLFRNIFN